MLLELLIYLGIIATPFMVTLGFDGREPKLMVATVVALSLGLFSKCSLRLYNKWVVIFLLYCLFAQWQAPKPEVVFYGVDVGNFYIWKHLFIWLSFYLGFSAVSQNKLDIDGVIDCMVYMGLISAIHCMVQFFGLHQFYQCIRENASVVHRVTGFLGNSNLVAPYIGMIVPLALYRKKYIVAVILSIGVIASYSLMGIGTLVAVLIAILFYRFKWTRWFIAIGVISSITFLIYDYQAQVFGFRIFDDSGRIRQWNNIISCATQPFITGKTYFCTGFGIDSFKFMYHTFSPLGNNVIEAHNEYLELFYELGLYGIILFTTMFFFIFKSIRLHRGNYLIYASLLYVVIASGGIFALHVGPIAFNSMILLGILNNKEIHNV